MLAVLALASTLDQVGFVHAEGELSAMIVFEHGLKGNSGVSWVFTWLRNSKRVTFRCAEVEHLCQQTVFIKFGHIEKS
ncbi:hypothetical protein D3C80_1874560 [compost metagenome]